MSQLAVLHGQVQLAARSIGGRIARLHEALHHLASLSGTLFASTPDDPGPIAAWLARERFDVDPQGGFFERLPHLARLREHARAGTRPDPAVDPCSYLWPPSRRDDPVTRHHLYAQRGLGPTLQAIRGRFPDVVWIYYQDDRNAALIAPALDGVQAIPPEFDWHGYHSFQAAEPRNNPEGAIRWSPPNIDYGGHGLIVCASIPVLDRGEFVGVWSMDVPLDSLLQDALKTPALAGRCFLAAADGSLIAHPAIASVLPREGGAVYRERLAALGGDFTELDLAPLLAAGAGELELRDGSGEDQRVLYCAIAEIGWLLFAAFPKGQLALARTRALQDALARVGSGDLSVRLDGAGDDEFGALARSYNDMTARLESEREARRAAESALRDQLALVQLQRQQIDALSAPVLEVGDGVLAVPLIGALGRERAAGLVERVLSEVTRVRARLVLLDLTGAHALEPAAVDGLLAIAGAVRLLGARCALSGLSPDAAATLVDTGAPLGRTPCFATLKAALAALGAPRPR